MLMEVLRPLGGAGGGGGGVLGGGGRSGDKCDRIQFPCHMGSHTPSSRVDLVFCCIFMCQNDSLAARVWDLLRV